MGYGLGVGHIYDPDYGAQGTHSGGTLGYHSLFIYAHKIFTTIIGPSKHETL
ncbi:MULTISPECIES: hypothetical protein [Legionella]|uniref:hypothetical protein n=1 Tax=Legionella TaxID=445 RepID=UPI002356314A|nr:MULTISPECIES: hypothetical protein [Legionella]